MAKSFQDAADIVSEVVLEIVRAIDRIILPARQADEIARIAKDVRLARGIDVQQMMFPAVVVGWDGDRLAVAADV